MMSPIASRASTTVGTDRPWWSRTSTMLVFMVMSTIPLWFVSTPPLIDFLGHIARYHVVLEIDHNSLLSRNWDYRWALIGNLGVDLLIIPIARLIGLEPAAWLVAAILPPLMIWGIFRAAKAIYGEVPPTAIAALPFALAYPYQYGFVNYWLASGLGFHAFALWVSLRHRRSLRAILFVPIGFAIWVCHVYGWAVFGVLVGGYELSCGLQARKGSLIRVLLLAAVRTWPLLTAIVAMVVWRSNGQGAETLGWFQMEWKLQAALLTLRDQSKLLDVGSLIAAIWLVYFGLRDNRSKLDPRFGLAALLLAAALLVIPFQLFGSAFADARIYPFLFIVTFLSIRLPSGPAGRTMTSAVTIGFATLFAIRIAASAIGYVEYDTSYKRHLMALDHIERGASVAILAAHPCETSWRLPRIDHMGSMALLRRDAFVNSQWDVPGAELLHPKRALNTDFHADPSQFVIGRNCSTDLRPALARRIANIPEQYFDYLWVLDFNPSSLPRYAHMTVIYQDESTVLYRIAAPKAK